MVAAAGGLAKDPVLRDQYGKLSPRRINAVRATLREILQRAKRERLLDTNPVLEVNASARTRTRSTR